ncbi:hypothetical protein GCM10027162_58370 [Streptomyces incanus]
MHPCASRGGRRGGVRAGRRVTGPAPFVTVVRLLARFPALRSACVSVCRGVCPELREVRPRRVHTLRAPEGSDWTNTPLSQCHFTLLRTSGQQRGTSMDE